MSETFGFDYTYRTKAARKLSEQLSLALAQGHDGAERAADKADRLGDDWTIRAAEALREYAKLAVGPFTIEKARDHCPPVPEGADARAWGHVTRRAVRLGWIERLPGLFAPAVSSHGSPKPMYRAGPNA